MKALVALAAVLAALSGPAHAEQMRFLMGTLYTVEAVGPGADAAVEAAFVELHRLDRALSTYKPDSELSRVNREAARAWTPVSPEVAGLVSRALEAARDSEGAFDPTVGPLVSLWGFKYMDYRVPEAGAIAAARARVGHRFVEVAPQPPAIRFSKPGVELDLGAIAKGYAVDRALGLLKAAGQTQARVDAGGNQGVYGPAGRRWTFGVKHPRQEGALLGTISLAGGGISTSGDAERGFWQDGRRYGHVLDPRTGRPVEGLLSVTVVAPTAEEADALSTTLYVQGIAAGRALLKRHPGCAALFVETAPDPTGYRLTATPGLNWHPEAP